MKRNFFFATMVAIFTSGIMPSSVDASGAHVRIIDLSEQVLCETDFTGTKGMDSIITTAAECDFTYTLGFGDDFLDSINGVGWDGTHWWVLYVDGVLSNTGVNEYDLDTVAEIAWVFSDGNYVLPVRAVETISYNSGVIVGLMSGSTGGLLDSDGDEVSDKDERHRGSDPHVQSAEHKQRQAQLAAAYEVQREGEELVSVLHTIFTQLQSIITNLY